MHICVPVCALHVVYRCTCVHVCARIYTYECACVCVHIVCAHAQSKGLEGSQQTVGRDFTPSSSEHQSGKGSRAALLFGAVWVREQGFPVFLIQRFLKGNKCLLQKERWPG